jgi:hypothetical protein
VHIRRDFRFKWQMTHLMVSHKDAVYPLRKLTLVL